MRKIPLSPTGHLHKDFIEGVKGLVRVVKVKKVLKRIKIKKVKLKPDVKKIIVVIKRKRKR